jgi:hypothetical protein
MNGRGRPTCRSKSHPPSSTESPLQADDLEAAWDTVQDATPVG